MDKNPATASNLATFRLPTKRPAPFPSNFIDVETSTNINKN